MGAKNDGRCPKCGADERADACELCEGIPEAVMDAKVSTVIDWAASSAEVRADIDSDDAAKWDAWQSIAVKLAELRELARKLEGK